MHLRLTFALASLAAVAAAPFGSGSTPVGGEILPAEFGSVAPCCAGVTRSPAPRGEPSAVREHTPPEGRLWNEAERKRIQEQGRWDREAPPGQQLGLVRAPVRAAAVKVRKKTNGLNQGSAVTEVNGGLSFVHSPPDTMIAAGRKIFVHATNGGVAIIQRKAGFPAVQVNPNSWFGVSVGGSGEEIFFDPKVVFDPISERFYLVYMFQTTSTHASAVHLAVSRSDQPTGFGDEDWCKYQLDSNLDDSWADYPGIGVSNAFLVLTTNQFSFGGAFAGAQVWVADKPGLADNASSCPKLDFARFEAGDDDDGFPSFTIQPAVDLDGSGGSAAYLFSTQPLTFADDYLLWRVKNRTAGRAGGAPDARSALDVALTRVHLPGTRYRPPPDATQKDTDQLLDSGDMRVTQTVFQGGTLYAVHALTCSQGPEPNEACVRLVQVTPSETLGGSSLDVESTFGAGDGNHVFWPGVALNRKDRVAVVAQASGDDEFLGAIVAHRPIDATDMLGPLVLATGTQISVCGDDGDRAGDYVGASFDPANKKQFIVAGAFADRQVQFASAKCRWNVKIGHVR